MVAVVVATAAVDTQAWAVAVTLVSLAAVADTAVLSPAEASASAVVVGMAVADSMVAGSMVAVTAMVADQSVLLRGFVADTATSRTKSGGVASRGAVSTIVASNLQDARYNCVDLFGIGRRQTWAAQIGVDRLRLLLVWIIAVVPRRCERWRPLAASVRTTGHVFEPSDVPRCCEALGSKPAQGRRSRPFKDRFGE